MVFVTCHAAVLHWRMFVHLYEVGLIVTGEACLGKGFVEQALITAVMGIMTYGTFSFFYRGVGVFLSHLCRNLSVACETEFRRVLSKMCPPNETMTEVAVPAFVFHDRSMDDTLLIFYCHVLMALHARLSYAQLPGLLFRDA